MKKQIDAVETFHKVFKAPIGEKPKLIDKEIGKLRWELMQEENQEYWEAVYENDIVEIADALGDMLYILFGTIISHGMQEKIAEVFDEIQRSNMSKLDKNGNPIYREDGKVLKSDQYFRPDLKSILEKS